MAKQNQAAETKSDKKSRPKVKPTVVEERSDDLAGLAQLPGGPIAAAGDGTIQAQAGRLGDTRLQTAQRQALAAQIGRVQGNRHLQRVVASLKLDEQTANSMPPPQQMPGNHRSVQRHAAQFGDSRFQTVQRQMMARQIGQVMGNQYLQRVMLQMKQNENPAKSPPSKKQAPISQSTGPLNITERTLPNGQIQQTIRMPFTQVISRSGVDDTEMEAGQMEQEEPIFIDQIGPPQETDASSDSINATLTHGPTVSPGGAVDPGDLGTCGSTLWLTNVVITPGSGIYTVTVDFIHTITWGVLPSTGPSGQVDIQNENDSDIKACNYQLVAKDLTPGGNNRSPQQYFWPKDIVERHELLHTRQRESSFGPDATTAMQNWLNARTATSAADVRTLIPQAQAEGLRVYNARVAEPATEGDAYADGAPLYQARADAIKTKGDAGGYGQVSTQVTVRPKGGEEYEIVRGDTLWAIAERTYGHGRYWRDIYRANPGKARDGGNLIFPGTVLSLPSLNVAQEVSIALTFGGNMYLSRTVLVAGSHIFLILPMDIFSDTTNCTGDVTIEVCDADGNSLFSTVWSLPGPATSSDANYEVTASIVP